jgi:hypothetical protein
MRSAAVGHQCVDCVQAAAYSIPPARTAAGGILRQGLPVVTYSLIAANVAVFVMQIARPGLVARLALQPASIAVLDQYYRLVTSAFMHYGLVHILFNMWALYVLGPPLEQHLGRLRFAVLYSLSLLGGSVVVYLFSPLNAATAGASGAIFGLFGATLVAATDRRQPRHHLHFSGDQLAGPRRRIDHRCPGGCGLRLRAPRPAHPGAGGLQHRAAGTVRRAGLVAHHRDHRYGGPHERAALTYNRTRRNG